MQMWDRRTAKKEGFISAGSTGRICQVELGLLGSITSVFGRRALGQRLLASFVST
jgi:hypothetical protein